MFYNATPYEDKGWCLVEKGSSSVVAAHLAMAAKQKTLPERYQRAEAARPKLIDITDCTTPDAKPEVLDKCEEPVVVLEETMRALGKCRFTFPSDRTMAEEMMADFEWTIKSAMDQAELAQNADILSIDPKLLSSATKAYPNMPDPQEATKRDEEAAIYGGHAITFDSCAPLGLAVETREDGVVYLSGVCASSPAATVPLESPLTAVNGRSCAGKTVAEVQALVTEAKGAAASFTITFEWLPFGFGRQCDRA